MQICPALSFHIVQTLTRPPNLGSIGEVNTSKGQIGVLAEFVAKARLQNSQSIWPERTRTRRRQSEEATRYTALPIWPVEPRQFISTFPRQIRETAFNRALEDNNMHKKSAVILLAIAIGVAAVAGDFTYKYYSSPTGSSCPDIFATVTYQSASGFTQITHPEAGTTEYVLPPNSTGNLSVAFSTSEGNLTSQMFEDQVQVWLVNTTTSTIQPSSGLQVSRTSAQGIDTHLEIVNYTIASGPAQDLYLIGIPSSCHSPLVNVGTSPYTGPLPW